jgi:hypothetical protein
MGVAAFEGLVDKGKIRLKTNIRLPERTRVYVVVPDLEIKQVRIVSPRLVHPEQAADFKKEMIEVASDANVR